METPSKVNGLELTDTCVGCGQKQWYNYMEGTTKADGKRIRLLIKKHLPDLYEGLALQFNNPYEQQCRKKEGLFVYVHSMIEYFIKYW